MSKTQPIYPSPSQQPLLQFQPTQLQNKLLHILHTLELENEEAKKYYTAKIDALTLQLQNKQRQLEQVRACVGTGVVQCGKCRNLEWKVLEKDNVVEDLNQRVRCLQYMFKQKLHQYIDKLDLTHPTTTTPLKNTDTNPNTHTGKRINISQYFIKAVENTKNPPTTTTATTATTTNKTDSSSTQMENISNKNDNISTKFGDISSVNQSRVVVLGLGLGDRMKNDSDPCGIVYKLGGLSKVKSLHQQEFYKWQNSIRMSSKPKHPTTITTDNTSSTNPLNNTQNQSQNLNIHSTHQNSSTNPDKFISSDTKQRTKLKPHSHFLDSNNSSIQQRRRIVMQQRWKQVSAFQRRRQNNRNRIAVVNNT